jgi:predicted MFS family arabinose efflux permease
MEFPSINEGHSLLGRVSSAGHLLFRGALPLGSLAGGAIAQTIGIRQTMVIGALGYLLSTLWFAFSAIRHVRQLLTALH